MSQYEQRQWHISEKQFSPTLLNHHETLFTLSNGFMGIRGSMEEGFPSDDPATFVAGIFNQHRDEIPELVSIPNPLTLKIVINEHDFSLDSGTIVGYERKLDLKTAILTREVLWLSPNHDLLRLRFERFISITNSHLFCIRVEISPLSEGIHTISIRSFNTPTRHAKHWSKYSAFAYDDMLQTNCETTEGKYALSITSLLQTDYAKATQTVDISNPQQSEQRIDITISKYETATIIKYVAIDTSRTSTNPASTSTKILNDTVKTGYAALRQQHIEQWHSLWEQADIVIEGDEIAQRALRFCIYHLLIAAPYHKDQVSIGAKSLSGYGYKGHIFWDAELFMLPPFTLLMPDMAKQLLMYRYNNLKGAREKARHLGYKGAMFPWESTDTGYETTPQWVTGDISGKLIRIWTGNNEQHITSDIVYAVLQYWQWTGDDEWMANYGAEIVLNTAQFWASRVEYNKVADRYELSNQIGPDEYHENINNPVYTNYLVKWHLQKAVEVFEWLNAHAPKITAKLSQFLELSSDQINRWQYISDKMFIPSRDGILEQYDGFFDLEKIPVERYHPLALNLYWLMGPEGVQQLQVIKQADVVMLIALFDNELGDTGFLRRNLQAYADIVDHGSSLSQAVYAWVEAKLELVDKAYSDWLDAALIDIDNIKGNTELGIHAACCGGVWQAVIFGFCGLTIHDGQLNLQPNFPPHWRSVVFKVNFREETYQIKVTHDSVSIMPMTI